MVVALEFGILLGYDGQLKQNSDLEMELFQSTIDQLNKTKMTKVENALMWLYVKTWGLQGQHVIDKEELWNFGGEERVWHHESKYFSIIKVGRVFPMVIWSEFRMG